MHQHYRDLKGSESLEENLSADQNVGHLISNGSAQENESPLEVSHRDYYDLCASAFKKIENTMRSSNALRWLIEKYPESW